MASAAPNHGERRPRAWGPTIYSPQAEITRLNIENEALRAHIAAHGLPAPPMSFAWAKGLTRQHVALVSILASRHPRYIPRLDVLSLLPARENTQADNRDPKIVDVAISAVRKRLGKDVIENLWGVGFRLSPKFWRSVMTEEPA